MSEFFWFVAFCAVAVGSLVGSVWLGSVMWVVYREVQRDSLRTDPSAGWMYGPYRSPFPWKQPRVPQVVRELVGAYGQTKRPRRRVWADEEGNAMSQPSGVFPALYDNVKKSGPKKPRKPKR